MKALAAGTLSLDPLVAADAPAMFDLLGDPRLYEHLDDAPPDSVDRLRETYTRWERRGPPDGSQRWLNWVIRDGGVPLGYVQATVLPEVHRAWLAYVLGHGHQGRGVATQATAAVMAHLAADHGVVEFRAQVEAANGPSIRLLERLGFEPVRPGQPGTEDLSPTERLFVRRSALDAAPPRR